MCTKVVRTSCRCWPGCASPTQHGCLSRTHSTGSQCAPVNDAHRMRVREVLDKCDLVRQYDHRVPVCTPHSPASALVRSLIPPTEAECCQCCCSEAGFLWYPCLDHCGLPEASRRHCSFARESNRSVARVRVAGLRCAHMRTKYVCARGRGRCGAGHWRAIGPSGNGRRHKRPSGTCSRRNASEGE